MHTVWNASERAKDAPCHRNITGGKRRSSRRLRERISTDIAIQYSDFSISTVRSTNQFHLLDLYTTKPPSHSIYTIVYSTILHSVVLCIQGINHPKINEIIYSALLYCVDIFFFIHKIKVNGVQRCLGALVPQNIGTRASMMTTFIFG